MDYLEKYNINIAFVNDEMDEYDEDFYNDKKDKEKDDVFEL